MSDKKGWGTTVLGWFIVQDPQADGTVISQSGADAPAAALNADGTPYRPFADVSADIPASSPDPKNRNAKATSRATPAGKPGTAPVVNENAAAMPNVFKGGPPPAAPGGEVDFDKVYESAGIGAEERERVTRTLDLLNSLPPDTEDTVKKQIVTASLRAFGVPVEKIIESGAQEIQALEGYIRAGAADTSKLTEEAEQRIQQYEEEIKKLRSIMQQRVEEQAAVVRSCNTKKLDVQKVLEFFGQEAVAKVVRESPKLHEPEAH